MSQIENPKALLDLIDSFAYHSAIYAGLKNKCGAGANPVAFSMVASKVMQKGLAARNQICALIGADPNESYFIPKDE